jgi:hypothetical protein
MTLMSKLMILGVGAAGYVLGARAGRERYEQIAAQAKKLRNNPAVRQKVSEAGHMAKDTASTAASSAADKVRHRSDSGSNGTTAAASSTQVPGSTATGFGRGDEGV